MTNKKPNKIQKLRNKLREQGKVIEMLSNKKAVKGLISALDDVKNGDYIILTN
ncbi:MAG: hypothetical protein AABW89_00360 [Nanoarchaeota archaeon]